MPNPFFASGRYSLRRQLLLWITIPMFILIPLDTTILYKVGIHFVHQSFDDSMDEMANDVIALVNESGKSPEDFRISRETQNVLFSNQYDKTYYAIYNARLQLLTGNAHLPVDPSKLGHKKRTFTYAMINHEKVRSLIVMANYRDHLNVPHYYFVQIAETLHKRKNLRSRILLAIVFPQILLLIVSGAMLLLGISKGLAPLNELNNEISIRTSSQLDPVKLKKVPEEATVLITSINLLIGRLRNAIQAQNRFIADAAHQLRTPLAGIQAQVELALSQGDADHALEMIGSSVSKLTHLVNQLLRLSHNQPEAANVIDMKPTDIFLLAQEVYYELAHYALQKRIDFGFEAISNHQKTNYMISGDAQRLKVMLHNLLDNAIRYTPNGGKVSLVLDEGKDFVELNVEDNGVGIPESERTMVFERFHRVLDNSQEGSGLGLSIVKEILAFHYATIQVLSPAQGPGNIMSVRFRK